jgi:hypothetical protein
MHPPANIFSGHNACGRKDIEELIRTQIINTTISDHMKRVRDLLGGFSGEDWPPVSEL